MKTPVYPFSIVPILRNLLARRVEYAPGLFLVVRPDTICLDVFYPTRKDAETVKIILQDGERFFDKFLFENLYKCSEGASLGVFSESSTKGFPIPFTVREFDFFSSVLLRIVGISRPGYLERFLAYFKITNFLMPRVEELYAHTSIPQNLFDHLDLPLEVFPKRVVRKIIYRCDVIKHAKNPDVAKVICRDPGLLMELWNDTDMTKEDLEKLRPAMEAQGVNFRVFLDECCLREKREPISYLSDDSEDDYYSEGSDEE